MQQTENMNGRPVIVLAQPPPAVEETLGRNTNSTKEVSRHLIKLGLAHLAVGIACIILQIVATAIAVSRLSSVGCGIWMGSLFAVAGVVGIFAGKKSGKCQVITFNVSSMVSMVFALILLYIAGISASEAASKVLMAGLGVIEILVAIRSSAVCCIIGGLFCFPSDPQYHQFLNPVETDLASDQLRASSQQSSVLNTNEQHTVSSSNQKQPLFNTSQQEPVFNPYDQSTFNQNERQQALLYLMQHLMFNNNHEQPGCNTKQQRPVFNANQQQPMLDSSQQQLMFNPNQQQLMFNPNQQQLMFNPNQQQLMFNPNQQQIMFNQSQQQLVFNPNQQQLMFNLNQQQLMFNRSQQQLVFNPNQQQLMLNPNQQQLMLNPNQQQPVFNPNQQQPVFNLSSEQHVAVLSPNQQQQTIHDSNQQHVIFNSTPHQIMLDPNLQQPVYFLAQPPTAFYPQQSVLFDSHQPNTALNSQGPDFLLSGTAGQGPDAGPRSNLVNIPWADETRRIRSGNVSVEDQVRYDGVEMLLEEGPFGDSENRF